MGLNWMPLGFIVIFITDYMYYTDIEKYHTNYEIIEDREKAIEKIDNENSNTYKENANKS